MQISELIEQRLVIIRRREAKPHLMHVEISVSNEDLLNLLVDPSLEIMDYAFHKVLKIIRTRLSAEDFRIFLLNLRMLLPPKKMKFLDMWLSKSSNMRWGQEIF